jgi:hypothetical protein
MVEHHPGGLPWGVELFPVTQSQDRLRNLFEGDYFWKAPKLSGLSGRAHFELPVPLDPHRAGYYTLSLTSDLSVRS